MKTTANLVIVVAVMIVSISASLNSIAQTRGRAANRNYDPKTVETLEGTVTSVEKTAPHGNRGYGVHLTLQTADNKIVDVHLGPAWYLDKQAVRIEAQDKITVTGSRVSVNEKPAIIASEIKKGAEVLKLRDSNGVPEWAGGGRRK